MKLAYWMYAGPAHIGVLRVTSSFKNVHAIMHAPLGDDYFNVMRSMLERERDFTPVTASIVDRHVLARGSQEKVVENIVRKNKEEAPDLILLTPTCTSSILQEDLSNFVERSTLSLTTISNPTSMLANKNEGLVGVAQSNAAQTEVAGLLSDNNKDNHHNNGAFVKSYVSDSQQLGLAGIPQPSSEGCEDVILADVNHYRVNELQAADRTLEQIVRYYIEKAKKQNNLDLTKTEQPSVNIIGIFTLGFHNQHDCRELKRLFNDLGIIINEIIPEGGNVNNLKNLPKAWFNFIPYREVGLMTAVYLKSEFNMPYVSTTPMGLVSTALCIREIEKIILDHLASMPGLNIDTLQKQNTGIKTSDQGGLSFSQALTKKKLIENLFNEYIDQQTRFVSQAAWFSRSIDCQNLTGKKAVVFGDATHAAAMTKILAREMGIRVSCAGTYCKHDADWFREQVTGFCDQILITDDHTLVGDTIAQLEPAAIFGTQMERHVGKRLDIPCGVISAPVHIQNFPLGYRPFLGYEGTNQIADLVYNSFNLGMEDHLLQIFGGHDSVVIENTNTPSLSNQDIIVGGVPIKKSEQNGNLGLETQNLWSSDSLAELNKVPGFVRGKVKRNTEKYALQNNISSITVEVMYAAKEALSN
jgi:light-independent protochlorophyllide reductase subunit B